MSIASLNTIKNWFKTGSKPTQEQFWDVWDSFRHKSQKVNVTDIEGLDSVLAGVGDGSLKLDKAGYTGTAQDLKDEIDNLGPPTQIIDYPLLTVNNVQEFELPAGKVAIEANINDTIQYKETANNQTRGNTFTQSGRIVIFAQATEVNNYISIKIQ